MSLKNCQTKSDLIKLSKLELDLYAKMFKRIVSNNIKRYPYHNELKQVLLSITSKELSFSYIVFKNYAFSSNSYYNISSSHNFDFLFNINEDLKPNTKIIILWYLFLFNSLCNKKLILDNEFQKISEMNEIRFLLEETNNIILKLFLSGKLDEKQLFIFVDFYLFWIEYYSNFYFINEKNRKIKNMFIFKYLFSLVNESTHEIMKSLNKEKMEILMDFMEKLIKSDEMNNEYNLIILVKFNFIQSFVGKLLCEINLRKINEMKDDYINIIIQFYIHFIKFKFSLSNIFDKFLDNTRIAYEHLYNFEDNLKKIDFDLNIQNFQIELLKKLIEKEEEIITDEKYPPLNDSFLFNGLDSIISFKIGNFDFDKNLFFFYFNFNPDIVKDNNKTIFPILSFQTKIKKGPKNYSYENIFLLYIEKLNKKDDGLDRYTLSINQSKTKVKFSAKNDEKIYIKKNINYYCCLNFEKNNINLFLHYNSENLNNNIIKNNIKISIPPQSNVLFSLGCCDSSSIKAKDKKDKEENKIHFAGYIGPVIFLKNLILKEGSKLEELIQKILVLKEDYKDLVFFYKNQNKTSSNLYFYNDDFVDYSSINQNNKKREQILISLIKKEIQSLDCSLYLIPNCFTFYHNKNLKSKNCFLPLVSNLCNKHKYYKIKKVNITLSSHNLSLYRFIYDNGFNYFCLQLEYFNQLIQYYLVNRNINKKFNGIFINDNNILIEKIIYIIKLIFRIFGNRGNEINLSKVYKQSFMTLFNLLKNLNKVKPIITDIIGDLISLSDVYKSNIFTNYYNLKDVLYSEKKIKNDNTKEKEKDKDKAKDNEILTKIKLLNEEKIRYIKEKYNQILSQNSSFFVGVIEILLSKEFYVSNIMNKENFLLMKLAFEKVSSIMDIKDFECLSFISYPNLFVKALSFTNVLHPLMVDYIPDIKILNYKSNNFYADLGKKNIKNDSEEDNNVLTSYFKLLNIFFRNKAIDSKNSKEYFQKAFRFALGNHRNYLPIVYNYLHMFYYFIAESYKFYITSEEISQIFDYLNEVTKLKEEDIYDDIGNNDYEKDKHENKETPDGKENEENLKINEKIQENNNSKNYLIFMKRKDKIQSIIICIMLEILFSQKEMPFILDDLLSYIKEQKISKNLFLLIKDEIDKYLIMTFNDNVESLKIKNNYQNISKYYWNVFNFLTILINSLLTDNIDYNNYEEGKSDENSDIMVIETQKMWYILAIINLLSDISNKIEDNINKEIYKEETIYCVINLLKFLYNILMNNKLNILYTHNLFFSTVESIFNHCNRLNLNYNSILINIEKGNGTLKTINEIIFDIYLEYSTNIYLNNNKVNFFKHNKKRNFEALKIQSYFILGNEKTKLKEKNIFNYTDSVSIFFINDYLLLANTNKKYVKNNYFNFSINERIEQIKDLENIIKNQNKFDNIFVIFFLIKIGFYKKEIANKLQNKENGYLDSEIKILNQINKILIDMQKNIIDDYKKLYILNKEYCSKSNSDYPAYNDIKSIIESKIINETKKSMDEKLFEDIINDIDVKINDLSKEEYNVIKGGLSSTLLEKKKKPISRKGSRKFSLNDNNIPEHMSIENKMEQNDLLNYNSLGKEDINDGIERRQTVAKSQSRKQSENIFNIIENYTDYIVPLSNIDNINCFFDQYDEMYLKNPKKELMNTIFAYNFQKSFFNNNMFKKLKTFYLNNFKVEEYTKVLDYPSKMKHYKNGIEPPKFLKYNKYFYVSKVFPITHDYFYNYMLEKNLIGDSIILFKNKLKVPNINIQKESNDFDYNCDLISIDHSFYGHLINSHENKYLIFEEKFFGLYDKTPKDTDEYFSDIFSICSVIKKPNKYKKDVENKNQRNKKNKVVERGINKNIIILYSEIEQIIERRFLLMWQGIEIYLKNGKSYFFNLLDSEKCQKILKIFNNTIELSSKIITKSIFEKHIDAIQNEWINNRLDTYEYLLFINKYSNRSYNDSGQYIVFPWLLKNYNKLNEINKNELEIFKYLNQVENYSLAQAEKEENQETEENEEKKIIDEKENISNSPNNSNSENSKKNENIGSEYIKYFREFKYPVSAQNEKNKANCIKRYTEDCIFNFKYHSGTHYSTSAYVYFYLMRNEPFSTLLVKLQNYSQENPNRMFQSIQNTLLTLDSGNDNRELIPEFFSKIDHFINLNCVHFGKKSTKKLVDDAYINEEKIPLKFNLFSNKINFIIEHKILLNSESIALLITDWLDNNFGVNQLPDEEDRPLSCNIYPKSTYEQKTDLKSKLIKYRSPEYTKCKLTPEKIVKKISDKINMTICFGQNPYQIFKEKHPKRINLEVNMFQEVEENKNIENKNKKYLAEKELDEDYLLGDDDIDSLIINYIRPEKIKSEIKVKGLYFEINPSLDKVFILSKKREILILESKLYDRKGENSYNILTEQKIEMPYFKFFEKVNNEYIDNYYILKQKYCFSSFIKEENKISPYFNYYNNYVNDLLVTKKKDKDNKNNSLNYYKFITCRYLDNSFKINIIPIIDNQKKKEKITNKNYKSFSFICQDFVTSCCTISEDTFLLGLRNGKFIKGKVFEYLNNINNNENIDLDEIEIKIKYEKIIQAHKSSINFIEVDHRLGLIITGGADNYVYIRKLNDLELLTPIKIKDKFVITMAKISPMNFLYVVCLNKKRKHSYIYGYTLSGIQFAKSEYGYYSNIDFTKKGNIVSLLNKIDIAILSGSNLKRIQIKESDPDCKEFMDIQKKVEGALWLQYDHFTRKNSSTKCRIISYISKDYSFNTITIKNIKYFD